MFSGCTVPPDSKETELGSSDKEASPSAGKNTGVVLVPCLCMEVCPYSFFKWCGCFWGCWVSFVTTDEFSVRVSENQTLLTFLLCVRQTWMTQSAFTCNRDEISSQDETHLGMKKFLFTCEFHPGMKQVEFIPGWNLIWKKTSHWVWWKHNKISHFSQLLKSEAWYVKNIRQLKARCIKWLPLNAWGLQLYLKRDSSTDVFLWILSNF